MANQPLGFQQEYCHVSFWKATGDFLASFDFNGDGKQDFAVTLPDNH
jgi:hypothetical protein